MNRSKLSLALLFSPYSSLIILVFVTILSYVNSPFGWGKYEVNYQLVTNVTFLYVISFIISGFFVRKNPNSVINNSTRLDVGRLLKFRKCIAILFLFCFVFQIFKFVNIKDIPLLGDPSSRYNMTLGGFVEYPTRLLPVFFVLYFFIYSITSKVKYILISSLILATQILFLQRQEIVVSILSLLIFLSPNYRMSVRKILLLIIFTALVAVFLIGGLAVLRYGAENISTEISGINLMLWVVHGDITTAIKFTSFVLDQLNGQFINGLYTLGSFKAMLTGGFQDHGAEYIRIRFTDVNTAQSLSAPLSYYADFGYIYVAIVGFVNGAISFLSYNKFINSEFSGYRIFYPIVYCQLLWMIRAGNLLLTPTLLLTFMAVIFIYDNDFIKLNKTTLNLVRLAMVLLLIFCSLVLVARI